MNSDTAINRGWWDEVTPVHEASEFYDVAGFLDGRNALGTIERQAVGDVAGRKLLHLQCHFGLDTLSWARLGAEVVGVDFSPAALVTAERLARECRLESRARFVEADVTTAGRLAGAPFDIVFTSIGVLVWISDLDGWAATIDANLADNGFFYFLDCHPLALIFDESSPIPAVHYDYFQGTSPIHEPAGNPDYADPSYRIRSQSRSFTWSISAVFGALENRGLQIHEVCEYPFTAWPQFPDMKQGDDGYWHRTANVPPMPLLLGFKARRQRSPGTG